MKDFDIARAVYQRLEPALPGRVALGVLVLEPEDVAEPMTVIHLTDHDPEAKKGRAVRNDLTLLKVTTIVDAMRGEVYSRLEPHMGALRQALFVDHNLGGVHHIIELNETGTQYRFNREEMTYVVDLAIEVKFRRRAEEP
ncbi:hypothetical protein [Chromobacterium haemolyticum]|uniref:hypothetical protein n=1 Tax=Chromobacterium haemolyticum TaxID=394935 RepID=UPI0009D9951F|nr:hypothetical protein [Chromobacterium haemolyticum]OQS40543.1 hypothetical protein B0T39_10990 [Chromobacterium haemolyticum]